MICAIGVGLSYASGVTVMYPVMKIFISHEGLQGWANRSALQSRLGLTIEDLDSRMGRGEGGIRVTGASNKASAAILDDPELKNAKYNFRISSISLKNGNKTFELGQDPKAWKAALSELAHAPPDQEITLAIVVNRFDDKGNQVLQGKNSPELIEKVIGRSADDAKTPPILLHRASFETEALRWAIDKLPNENPMSALIAMVVFFIFLCLIGSVFRYYQQYLGMSVANRVVNDLRRRMYDRVVQLPTSYFAQKGTADAMSRLTQDTGMLTEGVTMAFGKAVQEPVKAMGALCFALFINWKLTAMIMVSVPVLGLIIRVFSRHMRRVSRKALESRSVMLAIINETLIGSRVVKAYSAEGYERRRFSRINKKLLNEQIKLNHYNALSRPFVETLAVILSSVPMLIAAQLVINGTVKAEELLTLLVLFGAMLEPMRKLADVNAKVQSTNAAATRVFALIDMQPEPNMSHSLAKLPRHQRMIEFRDIVFSYPGHDEVVLNHISLMVKAGQNVAVVGGNGSGKTTLLQLLPRLYVPTAGQIIIDGVDIGTVSVRSLRKQIGLVTQDTLLFADTIYNNIAYGTRHATREQVLDASKRSFADEFITTLPLGYETRVGEHGVRLSGGQKQRIAIARAILRDPAILVLDEAMSQIDSDSEAKITLALREFTRNRTTFMIAHRFQSVISADMIVCLDKGHVAGVGRHSELLETCAPYRKLYEIQFDARSSHSGNGSAATTMESPAEVSLENAAEAAVEPAI